MNYNRKKHVKVIITISLFILILFFIIICLILKTYLGKIDYDRTNAQSSSEQATLTDEEIQQQLLEDEETDGEDSSDEEIQQLESQMQEHLADLKDTEKKDEVFNILLVGCDTRKKGGVGRSDTMILISVNEDKEKISMTSIMRDCYVSIPGKANNRINAAYAFGGGKLLLNTIETNFAVDVDKYIAVDFYAFIDIIDSIGGVDIEVNDAEIPVLNNYRRSLNKQNGLDENEGLITSAGMQHLDGGQALAYARIRYVGNADFERTERQRRVLTQVFEKAKTLSFSEIKGLLDVLLPEIKTNLTEGEIFSLMLDAMTYLKYDLESNRIPVEGSYKNMRVNGMAVLGIDLEKNQEALEEFIYGEE